MFSFSVKKRKNELETALLPALKEGLDLQTLHEATGDEVVQITENRFLNSKDPEGKSWQDIKSYVYRGQKRMAGDPPLRFHTLYKSFGRAANQKEVRIGTPLDYAKFHTSFPDNNGGARRFIPLREFMGITTDADYNRILDVVDDAIETVLA